MEARTRAKIWMKAPPEKVFEYVGDPARHGEWSAKAPLKVSGPAAPGKGARYHSESVFLGKPIEADLQITAFESPTHVALDAVHKEGAYKHDFTLRAENGGTTVERTIVLPPGPAARTLMLKLFIAPTAVRSEAKKALGRLKEIVER